MAIDGDPAGSRADPQPVILVVEDDRGIREALVTGLELSGYRVLGAGDGLEALQWLYSVAPALIIIDLQMPRMDSVTFVAELLRRGLRPLTPLLVLSGDSDIQQKAHAIGADRFLSKPLRLPTLLREVAALLSGVRSDGQTGSQV